MSNTNKQLQKLANINEDACHFYEEAEKRVEDPKLKETFESLESLHKYVVTNLQSYIRKNGGDPETHETLAGEAREFWGKLMASISNDMDQTFVEQLEEAEDRCLHTMEDAMSDQDLPDETKSMLLAEYTSLYKSHDYMKTLKDCMKRAS